jgi:hypothetical protein
MNDKPKPAGTVSTAPPKKPSPTATPENKAAAAKANTAKPQAETKVVSTLKPDAQLKKGPQPTSTDAQPKKAVTITTTNPEDVKTHDVKLSDVAPKVAAKVKEAKAAEKTVKIKAQVEPENTPDFAAMTNVDEFVAAYNSMVITAGEFGVKQVTTVRSFIDVKTGRLACERLHVAILKARGLPIPGNNKENDTVAKKASTKKTSKKTSAKKTKKTGGVKRTRSKFDGKDKIKWLGKDNPFRESSGKYERTERAKKCNGQTVDSFRGKGGKDGTLATLVKLKLISVGA